MQLNVSNTILLSYIILLVGLTNVRINAGKLGFSTLMNEMP